MTSLQNLVYDSSSLSNFKSWASAIGAFLSSAGWTQSSDTGQVNWSTIGSVPGSGASVFEIWQPNDGLANFYLKLQYGNCSGQTNCPAVTATIGVATNGAGTFSGYQIGPFTNPPAATPAVTSSSTTYECRFSGAAGRFSMILWRGGPNNCTQFMTVERSLNASGAYTGSHVTLATVGCTTGYNATSQQTLLFASGPAPAQAAASNSGAPEGGLSARVYCPYVARSGGSALSGNFAGNLGFDTVAPYIGYFDYPLTTVGLGGAANYTEGQVFTTTLYGATRTFVATASGYLQFAGPCTSTAYLCMRYD